MQSKTYSWARHTHTNNKEFSRLSGIFKSFARNILPEGFYDFFWDFALFEICIFLALE